MTPFTDIRVQPHYGSNSAVVTWVTDPTIASGDFYVYRSMDGAGGWVLLNDTPVTGTQYVDNTLKPTNLVDVPHYRVMCEFGGDEFDSPIIGIYGILRRKEYAACSKIMKSLFLQLSRGEGVKVLVYKPLQQGEISEQVDPDTLQHTAEPCGNLEFEENSFDRIYKMGYAKPVMTLMCFVDTGPIVIVDREDGLSTLDDNMVQARFLGFPHITPGDLIVNPATDDRYGVTETVKPFKFKGLYPVLFDTKLQLLQRSDVRYKIPLPTTLPKITPNEP